jgi:hypothetical protein
MTTPDKGTDTVNTLEAEEAAISPLTERATAAEARAEQAENLPKRAGQALAVQQHRARQAERERDAERSRAEGLSALLEATRLQLAEQRALMTDQALARALKAAQEANALREAEAARRSKGRWARLRAAWRGG